MTLFAVGCAEATTKLYPIPPMADLLSSEEAPTDDLGTLDLSVSNDLSPTAITPDQAIPSDLSPPSDLTPPSDLRKPSDLSPPSDLTVLHDLRVPNDLTPPPDLTPPRDLSSPPDLTPSCDPRINEVLTGTTSSGVEEFVEIYNPCPGPISLSKIKLVYRSAGGNSDIALFDDLSTSTVGATLASHGYLVLCGTGYLPAMTNGDLKGGLAEAGGGVALRDQSNRILDSMGWGTATNAYVRGTVATAPKDRARPGRSLARSPDGVDSGDNLTDFPNTTLPTPGKTNQIVAP